MSLVDEITLEVHSGKGGDGVVRWMNTQGKIKGGPAGGDGGRGGDILIRGVRDITILSKYRGNTLFKSGDGGDGGKNSLHGRNGNDEIIDLPIGSVVTTDEGEVFELLNPDEEIVVLKGGRGGYGNEHFKSSKNVTPTESTEGKEGKSTHLKVELRLIADIGLVGLPNAGKSSFLNAITNAKAKIGNYAFTTLDPNLGAFYGYVIADIPGIIEGASEGKGLGHKFLRHISRVRALMLCISVEHDEPISVYRDLLSELSAYDEALADIPKIGLLTKTDLSTDDDVKAKLEQLKTVLPDSFAFSIHNEEMIQKVTGFLSQFLSENK